MRMGKGRGGGGEGEKERRSMKISRRRRRRRRRRGRRREEDKLPIKWVSGIWDAIAYRVRPKIRTSCPAPISRSLRFYLRRSTTQVYGRTIVVLLRNIKRAAQLHQPLI